MIKLRFALVLLFSVGNGAIADTTVNNVRNPQPSTENSSPPVNPSGVQQQWSGYPGFQQPINVQETQPENAYNSEDYDSEKYQDSRIRLMLHPRKTITLNETNLRTWKLNPATNSYRDPSGVTEPFLAVRSGFGDEKNTTNPRQEGVTDLPNTTQPQNQPSVNSSTESSITQPTNTTEIDRISLVGSIANQMAGQVFGMAAAMALPKVGNETADTASTGNASAITYNETLTSQIRNHIIRTSGVGQHPPNTSTNATDAAYVDIQTDYDDNQDVPDAPESNSYVIVLSGANGNHTNLIKNTSSLNPQAITDSILYTLSNLTASVAMNQKNGRRILKELGEQKTQLNDVIANINNIYQRLIKLN